MNRPKATMIFKFLNEENRYKVFENGDIFSIITNKFLKPYYNTTTNSMYVSLVINGKNKKFVLHTLIYNLYKTKINPNQYITHIDKNGKNNHINNLMLMMRNENNKIYNCIDDENVEWKKIPTYDGRYLINKNGVVKSLISNKILEESISKKYDTYKSVKLIDKTGKRKGHLIHRLLYLTFVGKIRKNMIIDHINRNKQDNNLNNLRMITQSENVKNCERVFSKDILIETNNNFINISNKYKSFDFSNYEVNNIGEVRNKHLKILKTTKNNGYIFCYLYEKSTNEKITISIHQLVATIFLENPNNYPLVHHKDNNRENNNYMNLEWTTHKQNITYTQGKKLGQYDLNNNLLKIFKSVNDVFRELNKTYGNNIRLVCDGKRKTAFGYIWKWV